MNILYLSYDGLLEPLGQSQVLQYLKLLARQHIITLITYEKPHDLRDSKRLRDLQAEVKQANIKWVALKYHKRPSGLATAYDILIGHILAAWLVLTRRIQIVHARSYVPSVIALSLKKLFGLRYIFDMRGFWADERVDGGIWPKGSHFCRAAKWFEKRFLLSADTVVSLTHAGVDEIRKFPYLQERMPRFAVIPTCTNLDLFTIPDKAQTQREGSRPFTLGYVGSVGTWYLLDEMFECFRTLRQIRPDARMVFINRNEHDMICRRASAMGIPEDSVNIKAVHHTQVPAEIHRMDAGILFIKPVFSKKASFPTKLGEFLACGRPCLGNSGIGDVEAVLNGEEVGVVLHEFNERAYKSALKSLLVLCESAGIEKRCRQVAEKCFSLDDGVRKYDAIYRSLSN